MRHAAVADTVWMDAFEKELDLAFAAHKRGDQAGAEALCRQWLQAGRIDTRLHYLLGMVLLSRERPREALESLQRAAAMAPVAPAILRGLGCVYHRLKDFPKAVEFFRQAATLRPDRADSQDELGHACFELGELEAAEAAFRRAAELNPQGAGTWNNLGKTLKQLNRLEEAIAAYGRAVAIRPDFVLAHYGLALALLAAGDLPAGFREYEWRPQRAPRTFPQPRWQGESLAGRTLFLHAEHECARDAGPPGPDRPSHSTAHPGTALGLAHWGRRRRHERPAIRFLADIQLHSRRAGWGPAASRPPAPPCLISASRAPAPRRPRNDVQIIAGPP
jgi:tetratricopeptide (TPR) repeat protein